MSNNIEKLRAIAEPRDAESIARAEYRRKNRNWLNASKKIALRVLEELHRAGMTQKEFANRMGVSPAYIGKMLKGGENFTIETISKIEDALGVEIISVVMPTTEMQTSSFQLIEYTDGPCNYLTLSRTNKVA